MGIAANGVKHCPSCEKSLSLESFGRKATTADGLYPYCKPCRSEKDRGSRDPAASREANRRYHARHRDKRRANRQSYRHDHPNKARAHNLVRHAIEHGHLTKPEVCESCGGGGRIHGHHDDYTKPLAVRWLCPACHTGVHRKLDALRAPGGK